MRVGDKVQGYYKEGDKAPGRDGEVIRVLKNVVVVQLSNGEVWNIKLTKRGHIDLRLFYGLVKYVEVY